jgi:hypothetical protein
MYPDYGENDQQDFSGNSIRSFHSSGYKNSSLILEDELI